MGYTLRFFLGFLLLLSTFSLQKCSTTEKSQPTTKATNEQTLQFGEKINPPKTEPEEGETERPAANLTDPVKLDKSEPYKNKSGESRRNNGRSIDVDINKYTSPEFHNRNNVYTLDTSEDIKKYVNAEEEFHTSTEKPQHTSEFKFENELTTPKSVLFDEKYKKTVENIDQTLLEQIDLDSTKNEPKFAESKEEGTASEESVLDKHLNDTTKSTLDYTKFKSVVKNETADKNSVRKDLTVEEGTNLSFNQSYNDTKIIDEQNGVLPKLDETTTVRSVNIPTTKKSGEVLTKPPSNRNQSHILSNKIENGETTTSKPVNRGLVKFANQATTRSYFPKSDEESKADQVVQENQIIPIQVATTTEGSDNTTQLPEDTTTTVENTTTQTEEATTTTIQTEDFPSTSTVALTTETSEETTTQVPETTTIKPEETTTEEQPLTTVSSLTTTVEPSDKEKTTESVSRTSKVLNVTKVEEMTTEATPTTTEMVTETTTEPGTNTTEPPEIVTTTITTIPPTEEVLDTTTETTTTVLEETTTVPPTTSTTTSTTTATVAPTNATTTTTTTEGANYEVTDYSVDEQPLNKHLPVKSTTEIVFVHIDDVSSNASSSTENEETTTTSGTMKNDELTDTPDDDDDNNSNSGTIIAIVISCVGAVCLIALTGLLIIMRKRQKRFTYGQRCTPVSLDDYSVDNTSVYNSVRRKGAQRASKRSYGNPAFDDPVSVSHPLNFPAISKFSNSPDDMRAEFEDIPQITARTTELPEGCDTKNRYANVIPLPETRVFLASIDGYPNSDYINANYVTGPKNTKNYYIACQAPLQNTVDDFWRMVWEQQCKVVLMLTHLFENGTEKCVDYLPPSEVLDCHRLFGDFQVTLKKREVKDKYVISSLQLKNMVSNSWREVTHFWYLGWPEKGVPSEANSLIAYLIEARSYMKSATIDKMGASSNGGLSNGRADANPVVVHCSPGTGRTGTVIACDIAIREFEMTRLVDIPRIVYRIRRDRASSVQTKEQYAFIYKVINLYATKLTGGALDSI